MQSSARGRPFCSESTIVSTSPGASGFGDQPKTFVRTRSVSGLAAQTSCSNSRKIREGVLSQKQVPLSRWNIQGPVKIASEETAQNSLPNSLALAAQVPATCTDSGLGCPGAGTFQRDCAGTPQ